MSPIIITLHSQQSVLQPGGAPTWEAFGTEVLVDVASALDLSVDRDGGFSGGLGFHGNRRGGGGDID